MSSKIQLTKVKTAGHSFVYFKGSVSKQEQKSNQQRHLQLYVLKREVLFRRRMKTMRLELYISGKVVLKPLRGTVSVID